MNKNYFLKALCAVATFGAFAAAAQTPTSVTSSPAQNMPPQLREALKNIPAATGACRKEDFADKPGESGARIARKPDLACAITLEQLSTSLGKPETVLIDVRSKTAFDNNHIDGAINFSAAEIRTKRFLSNKFVVLLGDGKTDQDLYELCGELKGSGFKQTSVLRGGMLAWVLDHKPVIGATPNLPDLASLTPGELFQASKHSDNVIITLPGAYKLSDVLPMAVHAPANNVTSLKDFIQKHKKPRSSRNIVLVADERFDKSLLVELAKVAKPDSLLIYTGSEKAYRQFLHVQNVMWAKQAKGPTKPRCGAI